MKNHETSTVFVSKSTVLKFLQANIKLSKIEKILDFTTKSWMENEDELLSLISKHFSNNKIIVRSSAIGEDSEENSQAGTYESILNVDPKSKNQVKNAIDKVIKSYELKNNPNPDNQILVQSQTQNVITSGVIFTRAPETGSPYYIINFEDGQSTTGVTHGSINNVIKILRNLKPSSLPKKWQLLISAVREVESLLKSDSLDIEFGITKNNKIVIFQVRPITTFSRSMLRHYDKQIYSTLSSHKSQIGKLQSSKKILGKTTIFSDMADWNPAEIIGNNPYPLDYSLYDFLIMKHAWYQGRVILGYSKFNPHSLMVKYGNKPYVDVRVSFNSLIPNMIQKSIKTKLLNFYLDKLGNNAHLHDKVEFEILFTCFDLLLDERLQELSKVGFSKYEIKELSYSLHRFTTKIIKDFPKLLENSKESIEQMTNKREKLSKITPKDYRDKLANAEILLNDCKVNGTIPFSLMARIAFIATALLNSCAKKKYLSEELVQNFMNSLDTPLSKFQNDLARYYNNEISKEDFLGKYGHLRPGTYDITISRYADENPFLNNIKFKKITPQNFENENYNIINTVLRNNNLDVKSDDFFAFIKNSLVMREELKFEFTHNLSDAIELIADAGKELGFFREELSYLEINTILKSYKKLSKSQLKEYWAKKIKKNKNEFEFNSLMILPPLILDKNDLEIVTYNTAKPNFVTTKSISSNLIKLADVRNVSNFENQIILLEHADPGYDWIFTRNPAGLITKYGGVASHMAIRCSEIGLPAAIGCGEIIYEKLTNATKVMLDCKNQQIIVLEHDKTDKFMEEKKILKTLGYIK